MPRTKELATLVATIWITLPGLAFGVVNSPLAVMTPPLADQVTPVLLVLVTSAENCSGVPAATVEVPGVTLTTTTGLPSGEGDPAIARVAMPRTKELATLVATIWITLPGLALGAVNSPFSVMSPPVADQVTPVLLVLVTSAENCSGVPGATVEVPGLTLTTGDDVCFAAGLDAAGAGVIAEEHPMVASKGSKMIPARANC
jgi:hypothetical protein